MFYLETPPRQIETKVFSAMPENFRRKGVRTVWADANRPGHPTDCFIEGPSLDAVGNLCIVDIPGSVSDEAIQGRVRDSGLPRGTCHRVRMGATRWLAMTRIRKR